MFPVATRHHVASARKQSASVCRLSPESFAAACHEARLVRYRGNTLPKQKRTPPRPGSSGGLGGKTQIRDTRSSDTETPDHHRPCQKRSSNSVALALGARHVRSAPDPDARPSTKRGVRADLRMARHRADAPPAELATLPSRARPLARLRCCCPPTTRRGPRGLRRRIVRCRARCPARRAPGRGARRGRMDFHSPRPHRAAPVRSCAPLLPPAGWPQARPGPTGNVRGVTRSSSAAALDRSLRWVSVPRQAQPQALPTVHRARSNATRRRPSLLLLMRTIDACGSPPAPLAHADRTAAAV